MQTHDAISRYFLTGTAEEDRAFLDRAFITYDQLETTLSIDPGAMRILVGNKGLGKSALFEWFTKIARRRNLPVLLLRPDDLDVQSIGKQTDIASLKRGFYESLISAIAVSIGRQLRGMLTGASAKLYEAAVNAGARDPDFVGKVLQVVSAVAVPVVKVNGVLLAKDLAGNRTPDGLIRAVTRHLLASGSILFLMVDDTDQVASPADPTQLNRIWALLLAVRRLSGECPALRCLVSLRTEVWTRLESESQGQRDQTDHVRGLIVPMRATDELMSRILRRRLTMAAEDIGQKNVDPWGVFFENSDVQLPSSEERRPWDVFILKSARERPRDAIQLVRVLSDQAKTSGHAKIGDGDANEAMKKYSKERVKDTCDEFADDCSSLRRVFETFAEGKFDLPLEELRAHLQIVGSQFSLTVRGEIVKPDNEDDALRLLKFLHETGFLNPRVEDVRRPKHYRHILFQDDPYFVAKSNWNNMQAATWEIHPAFRSFLLTEQDDLRARR